MRWEHIDHEPALRPFDRTFILSAQAAGCGRIVRKHFPRGNRSNRRKFADATVKG